MLKTIEQSVHFPASVDALYELYMSPRKHAAFTGGAVRISAKPNSRFTAFDGMLVGQTLWTVPGQMVVQRWRSSEWPADDLDSLLILRFVQDGRRGRIDLVHANVPTHDFDGVSKGWPKYYWKPLRAYLRKQAR